MNALFTVGELKSTNNMFSDFKIETGEFKFDI